MVEYHILVEKSYNPTVPKTVSYWFENKKGDNEGISFYNGKKSGGSSYLLQIVPQKSNKKLVVKIPQHFIEGDDVIESLMGKKWFKVLKFIAYEEGKRFVTHTTGDKLESDLFGVDRILTGEKEKEKTQLVREIIYTGVKTLLGVNSMSLEDDNLRIHGAFKFKFPIGRTKRLFLTIIVAYTIIITMDELKEGLDEREIEWIVKGLNSITKKMEDVDGSAKGLVSHYDKFDDVVVEEKVKVSTDFIMDYKFVREVGALLVTNNVF